MQLSDLRTYNQLFRLPVAVLIAGILIITGLGLRPDLISWAGAVDVGYITLDYGSSVIGTPTAEKPESKLWYNDGLWWGSLFNKSASAYHIYRFDRNNQTWIDTNVEIDDRNDSLQDVLWDQASQKLYIVSHMFTENASSSTSTSNWGRLYRYSYNAASKTYSLDAGFPVVGITQGKSETLVIDKDSTGQLWVTYVEDSKVMVNHSLNNDATWDTPYALPVTNTNVSGDDISSLIAYQGNKIGVVWSNQLIGGDGLFMATHNDGDADDEWQIETIVLGGSMADDHINLKTDSSGRIFVASKTGLYNNNPLIVLHVRSAGGTWNTYEFSTGNDGHTRPIVMIDEGQNEVYVFATSTDLSEDILYKKSDINNISFPAGMGTEFIRDNDSRKLNDPSSTKQNVNSSMGMLVIASNSANNHYYHNDVLYNGGNPIPTDTPTNTATLVPPTDTPTPSDTATDTSSAATDTPTDPTTEASVTLTDTATDVPPTDTPVTPTDTLTLTPSLTYTPSFTATLTPSLTPSMTPTSTQSGILSATATCDGPNLQVTIWSGDGPFVISASAGINQPVYGIGLGTTTIIGPEKWDNLTVTETSGNFQSVNLGQFKCYPIGRPVQVSPPHRWRTTSPFPIFSWQPFPDAHNYRVWLFDDPDLSERTIDIRENSGGPLSMHLSQPLQPGRYFWRMRARVNRIWSRWSTRWALFIDSVAAADQIPDGMLRAEHDSPLVQVGGNWNLQPSDLASGGTYVQSAGNITDALSFTIVGDRLGIAYLQGVQFGTLVVEVDGQVIRMLRTSGNSSSQLEIIDGLGSGSHQIRLYSTDGIVAIDALYAFGFDMAPVLMSTDIPTLMPPAATPLPTSTIVHEDEATAVPPGDATTLTPAPTNTPLPPPNSR